jgi:predicted enzyme related to lactoylglutathione lyase
VVARLFRKQPDSSVLTRPRVFVRVFPEPGTLQQTVRFYESLVRVDLDMDMEIPEAGLHVVAVGGFLILEMDPGKLDRIEQAKQTRVTVLAPDLEDAVAASVKDGAVIVQERWDSPPGPGYRLRHADGLLVEYLEHRPSSDDVDSPGALFSAV